MRKIIVSINSTFNGVVTGPPEDETDIGQWSDAANIKDVGDDFITLLESVDTLLQGRRTFEDLARKWPMVKDWPGVDDQALRMGEIINQMPKIVVGSREKTADLTWGDFGPPTVIGGDVEEEIKALKQSEGGDIVTFGSPTLVRSMTDAGLVDEFCFLIYPAIVDYGKRLFDDLTTRTDLKLKTAKTYPHGAMMVRYEVAERARK